MFKSIFKVTVVLFALFCFVSTSWSSNKIRYKKVYGKKYVYLKDVARYYGMKCYIGRKSAVLRSRYSRIDFIYHKKKGFFNKTSVHYSFAPFRQGKEAFISAIDFLLFIDPILRYRALPGLETKVVMIDPGHGGKDEGARGRYHKEKDIVLKVAFELRQILKKHGYIVVMTRDKNTFLSLSQRAIKSKEKHADVFISIHANSASKTVKGIETYCLPPYGSPSTQSVKPVLRKEYGNAYDKCNSKLAYEIHKSLIKHTNAKDRGVKRSRFFVLRYARCPAVLLELGFLSNRSEESSLASRKYQFNLAYGIAEGIVRYHHALNRSAKAKQRR